MLAALINRGPYAADSGSVETFTIPAATDRDRGSASFSYQVSLITGSSTVALPSWIISNQASRQVTVAASGRVAGDHVIVVKVSDGGTNPGPLVSVPQDFTLSIVASGVPSFAGSDTTFELPENSGADTVVGMVAATDADDTNTSDAYPAYAITGTDAAAFEIDAASGVISVKSGSSPDFDFESAKKSYGFEATATDAGGNVGRTTVSVNLTNVNEAPAFAAAAITRSLAENAGTAETTDVDTLVGAPVVATDEDAGDGEAEVGYVLEPAVDEFEIDDAGQIKVKAATNFNHEVKGSYTVTVKASDNENAESLPKEVVISITNINEAPVMPEIANQGPYGASGDTTARTFTVGPADDVDVPADTITYAASIKNSTGLPAGVTFNTASAEFTLAAGARAAGEHVIEVTPIGTNAVLLPGTATGATVEFTLSIIDYIAGATVTIEVAEVSGHNETRAGAVSLGVVALSAPITGVSWSLRGSSSALAVARSSTSPNSEAVIRTAGTSLTRHVFDYENSELFARITLVASAGDIEYAQIVDVVLTDVDESLTIPAIANQSSTAGVGGTISLPAAANPAGIAVAYSVREDLPSWLSFTAASRELVVDRSARAGNSHTVIYRVAETSNTVNFDEETFLVNIVAPNTGDIVLATAGLTPLTRVDGRPNESSTTEISVHLSNAPDSRNVTLTLVNGSGLIDISPDALVFTPANYNNPQPVTVSVLMTTTFGSSDQQVTASVHNAADSDQNYIFATPETFKVDRDYVNRVAAIEASVPRLIVLAQAILGSGGAYRDRDRHRRRWDFLLDDQRRCIHLRPV